MTRRSVLVIYYLLLTVICISQVHDTTWSKEVSLRGGDYIKVKKRITLLDTDTFSVYTSFDIVVDNIKNFITEHDLEDDKLLLAKFFNTAKTLDRNLLDIQNDQVLKSGLDFRTSELIQKGKCLVYNKTTNVFEEKVIVTNYIKNWWSGIRFITQNNQQILDLITGAY